MAAFLRSRLESLVLPRLPAPPASGCSVPIRAASSTTTPAAPPARSPALSCNNTSRCFRKQRFVWRSLPILELAAPHPVGACRLLRSMPTVLNFEMNIHDTENALPKDLGLPCCSRIPRPSCAHLY